MPTTNVGYETLTAEEILLEIQQIFINVFGSNFNLLPSSINGQFIQELTNLAIEVEAAKALLYSGLYNPDVAYGIWLESICEWLNIERNPAIPSRVQCVCNGLSGTVIPANSQVLNTNGNIFYNTEAITIPSAGTITAEFRSQLTGAIPCSASTVNRIVQQLAGWDSINNPTDGVLGEDAQTDTSLRYTRTQTLALNSSGSVNSVISACNNNANIIDFYIIENTTNGQIVRNGVTVPAKSVYLSVYGGSDDEVSGILYNKLSAGCGMAGNTTYIYTDPVYTWNTFEAKFQRAVQTNIQMQIDIVNSPSYPADIVDQVKAAMINNYIGNVAGIPPVKMGDTVYASRFYPSLSSLGILQTTGLFISPVGDPLNTFYTLSVDKVGILLADNIAVNLV